jgi:hypothetical protein
MNQDISGGDEALHDDDLRRAASRGFGVRNASCLGGGPSRALALTNGEDETRASWPGSIRRTAESSPRPCACAFAAEMACREDSSPRGLVTGRRQR